MARFRKKPIVIEAVQWPASLRFEEMPSWLALAIQSSPGTPGAIMRMGDRVDVFTLEGTMTANPGDWIIRGVMGELYPCKPDIFEATYEGAE